MLDTVKLRSPALDEDTAQAIERHLTTRAAWRNDDEDGEMLYSFVSGSLAGSWDSSVAVNVSREEWVAVPRYNGRGHDVVKQECPPYVTLEGSVHKAMLGHNVTGGPLDCYRAIGWFVSEMSHRLDVPLPPFQEWSIDRLDWAEAYALPSPEACAAYIRALAAADYPRRKPRLFLPECVYFAGCTTAYKVYHKGPEFKRHDYKRLLRSLKDRDFVESLQGLASCIIRTESSIKAEKLKTDHGGKRPLVGELKQRYAYQLHEIETARLVKESNATMTQVFKAEDVQRRLVQVYGGRLAGGLYGTWLGLAAHGEDFIKNAGTLSRASFYRHRKQLVDAGCNWRQSDVSIIPNLVPVDFTPRANSPYRITHEESQVQRCYAMVG